MYEPLRRETRPSNHNNIQLLGSCSKALLIRPQGQQCLFSFCQMPAGVAMVTGPLVEVLGCLIPSQMQEPQLCLNEQQLETAEGKGTHHLNRWNPLDRKTLFMCSSATIWVHLPRNCLQHTKYSCCLFARSTSMSHNIAVTVYTAFNSLGSQGIGD